ncbi:outer membrane protein assembly factor BamC [Pleionea sp. CnH1-48]|uniref:outer membrane protein assembly factor BamC n=1 Tax=Pleionea sp. CnH1-48 TaxID=2954494 RepID=UPI0020979C47|nr:outer membrane protein assembly factor BamC [Pleionea sp. CnH1-48]MCO7222997.1 outer membrane protein assembly factor BamC [Pleionea sp. CnH1-48]
MKYCLAVSSFAALFLSGCSWLHGDSSDGQGFDRDYRNAKEEKPLNVPSDYDTSTLRDELKLPPKANLEGQVGDQLDRRPPQQILAVAKGMRANRESAHPAIFWEGSLEKAQQNLQEFFAKSDIQYQSASPNVVRTEWVVQSNETWWRSLFGSELPKMIRSKFDIEISPGVRKGETQIAVNQTLFETMSFDEDVWLRKPSNVRVATQFLNRFIAHIDHVERKENASRLRKLNKGFVVTLGTDADGNAALVADTQWRTAWLKSPAVLAPFGFKMNDQDNSRSTYFFEFEPNEPGFFASLVGADEAVVLDLKEGVYQLVVMGKDGGPVTMTIIDDDGNPLTDTKLAQLFPHLAEAFGRTQKIFKE